MMVKSIVSFIFCITIIIRGGGRGERENRSRKNGRKRTKQKKTAEHERDSPWRYRARRQTFFRVSLRPWSHLLPWWMKGVIIDETTQILRYMNTSFTSLLLTLRVVFATLPSVEIQGLTKMEKEREKMRAVLPFFYKTNTQKFSVRVHGIYGKKLNCIDSLQHRRVLRERVVFALLHRLRGQIVEEAVSPLKLFHRGWEVRNRVRVR